MKKHSGMRPQDIVILLKIISLKDKSWFVKDIAHSLGISQSEISESLHRSMLAGLISSDRKAVMKKALMEFLEHGLKYVYPQWPGAIVSGKPTAHSAPPLDELIQSNECYVWPSAEGTHKGQAIEPLYPAVVEATKNDILLYELLALTDAIRVGKAREKELAIKGLKERIFK